MITGPPGPEKSGVAVWVATTLLRGGPCLDGVRPGIDSDRPVVWLATTGDYGRLCERLSKVEFPRDRLFWPVDPAKPDQDSPIDLYDARWLEIVAQHAAYRRPAWIVIDRLGTRRGDVVPGTRRAIEAMAEVARDVGAAVTFLHNQDGVPATGPGRATEWASVIAKMATVMTLKRWAPATRDMQFKVIKTTLGDRPDPLRLRLDAEVPEVVRRPVDRPRSPVERAVAFLEGELAHGARSAFEVTDRAWWQNQLSPRTLQRAKQQLGIRSFKQGGRWWWSLA